MWHSKIDTDRKNSLLDPEGEGEGEMTWEDSIDTCILHMWNRSPVQVQCMKQGPQSWCTGTTQRDGMWREVAGGFGMEDTYKLVADSCQCMAKATIL